MLKRLIGAALALAILHVPALASQKTKAQLTTEITTQLPSSGQGLITAAIMRQVLQDMVDSWQQIQLLNSQTGTSYTFLAADQGKFVTFNNASPVAVTLPGATGDFAAGYSVLVQNIGAGQVTITAASGATLNGGPSFTLDTDQIALIVSGGLNAYRYIKYGVMVSVTCGAGLSGGTITTSGTCSITDTISANTVGASDTVPIVTFNSRGQMTSVVSATISAGSLGALLRVNNLSDLTSAAAARTNMGVAIGVNVEAWDADLDCLAALSTTGLNARTGSGTCAARTLQPPAAGITISNPGGVAGDPTFALSDDLAAVEGLSSNGIVTRITTNSWTTRTITGTASEISVANGDGISANPTVSLPSALVFSGKSIAGGTFTGPTINNGSLSAPTITTPVITNGTIDGTMIGAITPVTATISDFTNSGTFKITGVVSATTITSDQNNYAPTGITTATVMLLASDAARTITGISAGQSNGRLLIIQNTGSNSIVLSNENSSSTADNRFAFGADVALTTSAAAVTLRYDSTTSRWRPIASSGGSGGGGSGTVTSVTCGTALTGGTFTISGTCAADVATATNIFTATASKLVDSSVLNSAGALTSLTDAATVAVDMATGINFTVTLGGSRQLGNPSNTQVGRTGCIFIVQDATGSRTLSYASNWKFVGGTAPTLSTAANSVDMLCYLVRSSTFVFGTLSKGIQ